ncbi:MAG: rod shape-determining protein MreD [Candidatus Nealsonbacteria bacterium]
MKKVLILIIVFYILALLQTSFLIHLSFFNITPNFILIAVLLLNLLEEPRKNNGIFGAVISGFFWDIFSNRPIGFHILILVGLAILIKVILRNYLRPIIRHRF